MTDMSRLIYDLQLTVGPWPSARTKALSLVNFHRSSGPLSAGDASKLRGTLQWTDMHLMGRPCRAALSSLVDRQYRDETDVITDALDSALRFLEFAVRQLPDHCIRVGASPTPCVIMYTDATTEHGPGPHGLRLGSLVFHRSDLHPSSALAFSWDVPMEVQYKLNVRATQIMPAEMLAVPLSLMALSSCFRGRDVVVFIDNQAAMAALIRTSSSAHDCSLFALLTSILTLTLRIRPWFEYVDTKQNPAARLSRLAHCLRQNSQWRLASCRSCT